MQKAVKAKTAAMGLLFLLGFDRLKSKILITYHNIMVVTNIGLDYNNTENMFL